MSLAVALQSVPVVFRTINITVSVGVVELIDTDISIDSLMKRADKALSRAKHSGGSQTINFENMNL